MERLREKSGNEYFVRASKGVAAMVYAPGKEISQRYIGEIIDKLAAYEDAEEQGRLVVLPCKVGTKIYILSPRIYAAPIIKEAFFSLTYHDVEDFGKTVFLTREEAEKALEGMKNG